VPQKAGYLVRFFERVNIHIKKDRPNGELAPTNRYQPRAELIDRNRPHQRHKAGTLLTQIKPLFHPMPIK
jgi:hypothetical protein